ncbi:MAG: sarcosine oxidase subunit alpha family protein [Gammaproteobacteria bacterium]
MSGPWRAERGGRISREHPLGFTWDGVPLKGYRGDTLASALLAQGVQLVGRSFKYHRPRGILSAGAEEPNALVTLRDDAGREDPNTRATTVLLREGLAAYSQNCWPGVRFDVGALNRLMSPLWSAGFYYKTFMWPRRAWKTLYEPFIRRAAGLGRAPAAADPDQYSTRFAHCDVLVVGAGAAGLAAALAASDTGARVILCDEQHELGGGLLSCGHEKLRGKPAAEWLRDAVKTLTSRAEVTCLPATTAFGYYADNMLGLLQDLSDAPMPGRPRQRLWQVRAGQVVLATGAIERPLVFPGNDRPGILLASAARTYLNRYAVRTGKNIVIYASDDSAYMTARELQEHTGHVRALVDPRVHKADTLSAPLEAVGIEVLSSHAVTGTSGGQRISGARIESLNGNGRSARTLACDCLLMAGGWTPTVHLFSQTRSPLQWSDALREFIPAQSRQATFVAGASRGLRGLDECVADGEYAGDAAACALRASASSRRAPVVTPPVRLDVDAAALDRIATRGKSFVDFQNDVCASDIAQAMREGFQSVEHLKRYTTTGMATDQGKTSNLNAIELAARCLHTHPGEIGTTTFRAPYTPVTFGALAGEHRGQQFDPVRVTPMHEWAVREGAAFEPVALWQRARYFPRDGEDMHQAVRRECRVTRSVAGLFDASTLGKIEVVGPDAAEFLERMYTNAWANLQTGRCRYGLLLREDGFVFDDGVVGRIAADRFHVTTTTGGAARVLHHMEDYLQTEFPELRVWLTSTTDQWAVIAINGPMARRILEPCASDVDLSGPAFPHMAVREGRVCGVDARIFRVSFSGELGFEVNVPSDAGLQTWEALQRHATRYGAVTYGTETMHVLRAEKGYIIVGQDTDGTVTPQDLGMEWAIGKSKTDFVGKRGLLLGDLNRPGRKQFVGLLTSDGRSLLEEGAQVVSSTANGRAAASEGHVTSSYFSEQLNRPIALGLVADGRSRIGTIVRIPTSRGDIEAQVVSPVFYDADGARLNV